MKRICPKCSSYKFWSLKDGRFRCSKCRKTFSDPKKQIRISQAELRTVVGEYLLEHFANIIPSRVDISKYILLKVLTLTWRGYTGIAAKGYVHRLVNHSKSNYVTNGNHINSLEGFWGLNRNFFPVSTSIICFEGKAILPNGPTFPLVFKTDREKGR